MDALDLCLIESEALIHKQSFCSNDWAIFSCSFIWAKIKRKMNHIERAHFRKCWEDAC